MPKCYQLIGVPGAGKSTWIARQDWAKDCAYISTDKLVDAYAHSQDSTYNEVFKDYMPTAVKLMADEVVAAREAGRDIVWDQTSTTLASRRRKFAMLPGYTHYAVVLKTPEPEELSRRLNSRPGKIIPEHVVRSMISNFVPPTIEEGFSEVWFAE